MPANSRDREIVRHILRYCRQIEAAHGDFGRSRERFDGSTTYQNAICMCILQIGELIGKMSDDFMKSHTEIPWHKLRGVRNFVAHEYGHLDLDIVWFTATNSISELQAFCAGILKT